MWTTQVQGQLVAKCEERWVVAVGWMEALAAEIAAVGEGSAGEGFCQWSDQGIVLVLTTEVKHIDHTVRGSGGQDIVIVRSELNTRDVITMRVPVTTLH